MILAVSPLTRGNSGNSDSESVHSGHAAGFNTLIQFCVRLQDPTCRYKDDQIEFSPTNRVTPQPSQEHLLFCFKQTLYLVQSSHYCRIRTAVWFWLSLGNVTVSSLYILGTGLQHNLFLTKISRVQPVTTR
ncbi:hypothetical protein BD309DRAFT_774311 [Dichomitus squalens]|uniref:Uncharacterized protein n=1 Tax=Dichomitus squalens TaxID=114155 RepID=A0A4Q9PXS2_9APHY|nr:hypothetical protein BD309DRAFT_774311 [Dichomitus squalens]TBU59542.1 hypothetical protein BD310DRAFT_410350 [Dichomitus squalens]